MREFADLIKTPVELVEKRPWWAFWRRRKYRGLWLVDHVDIDGREVRISLLDFDSAAQKYMVDPS